MNPNKVLKGTWVKRKVESSEPSAPFTWTKDSFGQLAFDVYEDILELGGKVIVQLYCECMAGNYTGNRFWFESEFQILGEEEAEELKRNHRCKYAKRN